MAVAPTITVALLVLATWGPSTMQVQGACPADCPCPGVPPEGCAPEVPLVPDDCGCGCQVCAGQLNEDCGDLRPCDPSQDLLCDYGAGPHTAGGICRASQDGRSCFFNGSVYLHEERFQIDCHSSCFCQDGALACIPLCPLAMPVIAPGCIDMQQVEVPGQCCKEWRCVESNRLEDWLIGTLRPPAGNAIGETPRKAWAAAPPSWAHHGLGRARWRQANIEELQQASAMELDTGSGAAPHEGRTCSIDGTVYQHKERFHIACHSSCVCRDGSVACVSMCPPTQPPMVPGCTLMEQVEVPGQCCKQWSCLEFSNEVQEEAAEAPWGAEAPWSAEAPWGAEAAWSADAPWGAKLSEGPGTQKRSMTLANRSIEATRRKTVKGKKRSSNEVDGDRCQMEPTEWTPCSKSCGTGMSTRQVWSNGSCTPRAQRRICMEQPCGDYLQDGKYTVLKAGKRCTRLTRPLEPQTWTFKGCQSQRPLLPNYCGYCSDGRRCQPFKTLTVPVKFQCEGGAEIMRKIMWVQNCSCKGGKRRKKGEKGLQQAELANNA